MDGEGLESYPELLVLAATAEQLSYAHECLVASITVRLDQALFLFHNVPQVKFTRIKLAADIHSMLRYVTFYAFKIELFNSKRYKQLK